MKQLDFSINIAHLYPDLLNIYGDMGNIYAIIKRCQWRNIKVNYTEIRAGKKIDSSIYELYFIGGGQDNEQNAAAAELKKNSEELHKAANENAVFLGICGGYQLLGEYYQPFVGDKLEGIGLLNARTTAGKKRFIGNVSAKYEDLNIKIAGFENHSGLTYLGGETKPLFKIIKGKGNNGKDKTEGARYKNVFGTYLHGSFLPKNPVFCDYLIGLALEKKYRCQIPLSELDDTIEEKTLENCLKIANRG